MLLYKWMSYARKIHFLAASFHLIYVTCLFTYIWKTFLVKQAYDPEKFSELPPQIAYGLTSEELTQ